MNTRAIAKLFARSLAGGLISVSLWQQAAAQNNPPPAGPLDGIQVQLELILQQLGEIESKIDNQTTDLRGVTQNWDKKLDSTNGDAQGCNSDRFTCLFDDTVVRDNETGAVWERAPDIAGGPDSDGKRTWGPSIAHCINREVGGRKGFRLPLVEELASLVDTTNSNPALPTGHPFFNVQTSSYWTATTDADTDNFARNVDFSDGGTGGSSNKIGLGNIKYYAWCVRGGKFFDGNTHETIH